jgi:hypothetical protein
MTLSIFILVSLYTDITPSQPPHSESTPLGSIHSWGSLSTPYSAVNSSFDFTTTMLPFLATEVKNDTVFVRIRIRPPILLIKDSPSTVDVG